MKRANRSVKRVLATLGLALAAALTVSVAALAAPIADNGFESDQDGYSFQNFGSGYGGMTSVEMRRLFGNRICSGPVENGHCQLTPEAELWMQETNKGAEGGHCYGFASTAQRFFAGLGEAPERFGASTVPGLQLDGNRKLQAYLTYAWSLQSMPRVARTQTNLTPNGTTRLLEANLPPGEDRYVITIFGEQGGHAVTPIAVERDGANQNRIAIYDNNWPGQVRYMEINTEANTWSYQLAPGMTWDGTAKSKTFQVEDPGPGFERQPCFICPPKGKLKRGRTAVLRMTSESRSGRTGSLTAVDRQGRESGFVGARVFNGIPGVEVHRPVTGSLRPWRTNTPPEFTLPTKRDYEIQLRGRQGVGSSNVSVVGRGTSLSVSDLVLKRGERDRMRVSERLRKVVFENDHRQVESPTLTLTSSTVRGSKDYRVVTQPQGINRGAGVDVSLDSVRKVLRIRNEGGAKVEKVLVKAFAYGRKAAGNAGVVAVRRGKVERIPLKGLVG